MMTRIGSLQLDGIEIGTTPMMVPSLSSRVNEDIALIDYINICKEFISGPILLSAYDIHYLKDINNECPNIDYPSILFIDSGGYECQIGYDTSVFSLCMPRYWNEILHRKIIASLDNSIPKVIVSFDHPYIKLPIAEQLLGASDLFENLTGILKEILIKSEPSDNFIQPRYIIDHLKSLSSFDIIGFTERELGSSLLERMSTIARIRRELDKNKLNIPIHIFGGLDVVTTPLYYISGADIFDGLSWLRYVFLDGKTFHLQSLGLINEGIDQGTIGISVKSLYKNYLIIRKLEETLEKFHSSEDFDDLGENAAFFKKAFKQLIDRIGGDS